MRRFIRFVLGGLLITVAVNVIVAQTAPPRKVRRAEPPDFSKVPGVNTTFFPDVFSQALEGERPANLGAALPATVANPSTGGATSGSTTGSPAGASGWSKVVSATAIEDEIKAIKLRLDPEINTPTKFAGSGHKAARREFTLLAVLYGIIGEYEGDVRWKDVAPGVRDAFARGAANAKVSTPQAFNEAKLRLDDLGQLIGGGSFGAAGESERTADWPKVCDDRSPLMQRLESAHQGKLQVMTASADEFKNHADAVAHEANILAALAEVLGKEGMPDADADDYAGWVKQITTASGEILEAVKSNNYDQARKAVGTIGQACSQCHELYR
jgi:hypothetical protein